MSGPQSHVSKMTQQSALVSFQNSRVQWFTIPDSAQKIVQVNTGTDELGHDYLFLSKLKLRLIQYASVERVILFFLGC